MVERLRFQAWRRSLRSGSALFACFAATKVLQRAVEGVKTKEGNGSANRFTERKRSFEAGHLVLGVARVGLTTQTEHFGTLPSMLDPPLRIE